MNPRLILKTVTASLMLSACMTPTKAADLVVGSEQSIPFTGTYEDFTIPATNPPAFLQLTVFGGDGGDAYAGSNLQCFARGGQGGTAEAIFRVGYGLNELEPGGTIRFIVGGEGTTDEDREGGGFGAGGHAPMASGGGGGGSGIIYRAPGNLSDACGTDWIVLVAAGGGGGATQGAGFGCNSGHDGGNAQTGECGRDGAGSSGGDGGCNGQEGETGGTSTSGIGRGGGGAGAFGESSSSEAAGKGCPTGGDGGIYDGFFGIDGGWGFGGGGYASLSHSGGGGGYSGGGGGGGSTANEGGGGGSYVSPWGISRRITSDNGDRFEGEALYLCINGDESCTSSEDCNENGVPDDCDLDGPGRFDDFGSPDDELIFYGSADIDSESVLLTPATAGQSGSVIIPPATRTPIDSFSVRFDYKMGGGTGANGMSFIIFNVESPGDLNPGDHGGGQPLAVVFDTYQGDAAGGNHAEILSYGTSILRVPVAHTLDNNQWQHAYILFENGELTLVLQDEWLNETTIFDAVPVPGFSPIRAGYGFGAVTGAATNEHRVDNVRFKVVGIDSDCDANGTPDECQADTNGDGTPNACEDDDGDGVPNFEDQCEGDDASGDTDGDEVCDDTDICPLDSLDDSDGDGVCDSDDLCQGSNDTDDCNTNGVPDECDSLRPSRLETFKATDNVRYTLNQSSNTSVVVDNGSVRLTEATQGQRGTIIFEPVTSAPVEAFIVEFDFYMGGGTGADGMSFALIDADSTGSNILFGEDGGNQPLVVGFDTYRSTPAGGNHAMFESFGVTLADELVAHQLDDGQWQHASFKFEAGAGTLVLTDADGIETTIFSDIVVPNYTPIRARYGFGARTGGVTNEHRVDNVYFDVTSLTNDCNSNGVPDECDADADGDGVPDECDICADHKDYVDDDSDGVPNGCDTCPFDEFDDSDGDGSCDSDDICPGSDDTADADGDALPDACDLCPNDYNPDQADRDGDGIPDACDTCPDSPNVYNPSQGTYYPTIADAIDASTSGEVIELGACVLVERDLIVDDKDITLRGQGADQTILDGDGVEGGIMQLRNGSNCTIEDITFRNGISSGTIGGALRIGSQSTALIQRCRFQNNRNGLSQTGAVFAGGGSESTFLQCVFEDNHSDYLSSVVKLAGSETTVRFVNSLFRGNGGSAPCIAVCDRGSMEFANCTFVENLNLQPFAENYDGEIAIRNSIHDDTTIPSTFIDFFRCLFPGATGDNIDGMPTFVDAANGDFRLAAGSLGIDAADHDAYIAAGGDATDLNGDPRTHDDTGITNTGSGAPAYLDLGAFEFQGTTQCGGGGDFNNSGSVDLDDYRSFTPCMEGPEVLLESNCGCFDLDSDGDVDVRDFAEFQKSFTGSR